MRNKTGRFSGYIRPFSYLLDLIIVNVFSCLIISNELLSPYFLIFTSFSWVIIAFNVQFYEVYRFTKVVSIANKIIKQFLLFTICCYAFSGFYVNDVDSKTILIQLIICLAPKVWLINSQHYVLPQSPILAFL